MYVFGIDIPIMEVLFVIVVGMFGILIFVLLELRKLTKDLELEEKELNVLGDYLNISDTSNNKALLTFIQKALQHGYNRTQIKKMLLKNKWNEDDINKAFEKIK